MLEAVARLTVELRRAPYGAEVARATNGDKSNTRRLVTELRALGLLTPLGTWGAYERVPLRLTAWARVRLGLPLLVYLAWPLPRPTAGDAAHRAAHAAGAELARQVLDLVPGACPVSPYLTPHLQRDRARLDAAAVPFAAGCDAAIVWRDRVLLGRPDVAAAMAARLDVAVIDATAIAELAAGASPWSARWIVTEHGSSPQRRSRA